MVGPALVVQIMIASCTSQQPSENFQKIGLLLTGPGWYIAPLGPHKEVRGRERKRKKKKKMDWGSVFIGLRVKCQSFHGFTVC